MIKNESDLRFRSSILDSTPRQNPQLVPVIIDFPLIFDFGYPTVAFESLILAFHFHLVIFTFEPVAQNPSRCRAGHVVLDEASSFSVFGVARMSNVKPQTEFDKPTRKRNPHVSDFAHHHANQADVSLVVVVIQLQPLGDESRQEGRRDLEINGDQFGRRRFGQNFFVGSAVNLQGVWKSWSLTRVHRVKSWNIAYQVYAPSLSVLLRLSYGLVLCMPKPEPDYFSRTSCVLPICRVPIFDLLPKRIRHSYESTFSRKSILGRTHICRGPVCSILPM